MGVVSGFDREASPVKHREVMAADTNTHIQLPRLVGVGLDTLDG